MPFLVFLVIIMSLINLNYDLILIQNVGLNTVSPSSDQHKISPCNINAYSTPEVMRMKDMINQALRQSELTFRANA